MYAGGGAHLSTDFIFVLVSNFAVMKHVSIQKALVHHPLFVCYQVCRNHFKGSKKGILLPNFAIFAGRVFWDAFFKTLLSIQVP